METPELRWCPGCKQMQEIRLFKDLRGRVQDTCEDCRASDPEEYRAERERERTQQRQLARFKRVFGRQDGAPAPKRAEREFWNLTADPFPVLFGGKGLSADYCPLG